ncbi:MAG TPA: DUF3459 domain-containing protein [Gammaproteobacteria bacterium]|jgi:hypothetical protein|nr:DUF3459 domain-containing protein [Gammaproteobacteria bacterium]
MLNRESTPPSALRAEWYLDNDARLSLLANLGQDVIQGFEQPKGDALFPSEDIQLSELASDLLLPWSVACFLER